MIIVRKTFDGKYFAKCTECGWDGMDQNTEFEADKTGEAHQAIGHATPKGEFTAVELFPPKNDMTTSDCTECGAYVKIMWQVRHIMWHNKVANL